jgi:Mn2+/Fe2+ NRAMP family transporter
MERLCKPSTCLLRILWPRLRLDSNAAAVVVAVFGTTISPYLFFWQASQEVEDHHRQQDAPLVSLKQSLGRKEFRRVAWDSWSGMLFSNLTAYFMILSTALTLHGAGVRDIKTAAEAAEAPRPLAGDFAFLLLALGILSTGLIGVITLSVLAALILQFSPINSIKALFWSSVINGIVTVPLMVVIILLSSKRSVMGSYVERGWIRVLAWIATAMMGMAVIWMFLPYSGPSS